MDKFFNERQRVSSKNNEREPERVQFKVNFPNTAITHKP